MICGGKRVEDWERGKEQREEACGNRSFRRKK
jgi:hypothetical protein